MSSDANNTTILNTDLSNAVHTSMPDLGDEDLQKVLGDNDLMIDEEEEVEPVSIVRQVKVFALRFLFSNLCCFRPTANPATVPLRHQHQEFPASPVRPTCQQRV